MSNPVLTWLAKAGKAILKGLTFVSTVAKDAEPEIDLAVPAVAGAYNAAVGFSLAAEAALGAGTGPQKLTALTTAITNYAAQEGWTGVEADVQKWASAFADSLNLWPFAVQPPAAPPATPPTP